MKLAQTLRSRLGFLGLLCFVAAAPAMAHARTAAPLATQSEVMLNPAIMFPNDS